MKPSPLTYHRPESVDDAVALLARLGDAKVLAGGQSLVPLLSMRLAAPAHVVDVGALQGRQGLSDVEVSADGVRVGALVTHARLERDVAAGAAQPLLPAALRLVAHPTIRNRGTTVGSVVHADPSAEMPAVLTLLGGSVEAVSVRGRRTVPASELFVGPLETSLAPDELAVSAWFPVSPAGTGTAVAEIARRRGDYAVVGVVGAVTVDESGTPVSACATYVSAGETGVVVELPVDGTDDASWTAAAGRCAGAAVETDADVHASAAYRTALVEALTARVLAEAAGHARSRAAVPA